MWTGYMAQSLVSQFNKFLQENSHRALLRVCTVSTRVQHYFSMTDQDSLGLYGLSIMICITMSLSL